MLIEYSSKNVTDLGELLEKNICNILSATCCDYVANGVFFSPSFSRPALKKYIQANYKGVATDRFDQLFNQALKKGAENNEFAFPKGMYLAPVASPRVWVNMKR